jgi:hypothetical protein
MSNCGFSALAARAIAHASCCAWLRRLSSRYCAERLEQRLRFDQRVVAQAEPLLHGFDVLLEPAGVAEVMLPL